MTLKLSERLARLEFARATATASTPMPPVLVGAYLRAVAIALGGYPCLPEEGPSHPQDSISNGFARGLGYADRDEMEARVEVDPDDWRGRMVSAEAAMTARYVTDTEAEGAGRGPAFQIMVGVLDEIAHAKAMLLPGEPSHLDRSAQGIRQALGLFGVTTEEQIAEACG